ncbi:hypothetical protein [Pseudochrobactrum sp. Wa41.01b-1]|uniref:hypothetical protein n=1 Tax=Pseudochrobactrum sp. Wa41.01b-1 TaxID=2864102 RepID=UPI002103A855|nr:hypothetical protein [Pseudochrobactrum sp. Wa41.01b-1]
MPPLWYLVAWDPAREGAPFRMDWFGWLEIEEGVTFQRRYVPFEDHVRPVRDLSR